MLINLLIYAVATAFSAYVIVTACRNFVGYNPTAPSVWTCLKAWWPVFVKRHIIDDDPYDDESHAATRYANDYIDWSKIPEWYDWACVEDMPESGQHVLAYPKRPVAKMGLNYESFFGGNDYELVDDAIIGPLPPWRESLRHRPGK